MASAHRSKPNRFEWMHQEALSQFRANLKALQIARTKSDKMRLLMYMTDPMHQLVADQFLFYPPRSSTGLPINETT